MKKQTSFHYKETYCFYTNGLPFNGGTIKDSPLGGSESAVVYLARELAHLGKKVIVFTPTDQTGQFDGVWYQNTKDFLSFTQRTIIDVFVSVRDVEIFAHQVHARLKVLWLHDNIDQPHMAPLSDAKITKEIDHIITISEWQQNQFQKKYPELSEKFILSSNGVNKNYFRKYQKKRKKRLIYTSTPFRGLEMLFDCFPEIKKQVKEVELDVYSSMRVYGMKQGKDRENFGEIYAKGKQPGVILHGSVCQEELAKKLSGAYLFVYPNHFEETSCIAALEAQAAGVPCVVTKFGALVETVLDGKTGTLIEGDPYEEAFQKKFIKTIVKYLKDDALWEEQSSAARDYVLKNKTWAKIAKQWAEQFDETIPTLSVCMIVKNEEKQIEGCLKSIKPIADEIIVVDTGSTDNTKSIAKKYDCEIVDYEWEDDFAKARNISIEKATKDWILILDADERLAERDLVRVRELINLKQCTAFRFLQRTYTNDSSIKGWVANQTDYEEAKEYAGYHDSVLVRLFQNHKGFQYEGKVHELVEHSILNQGNVLTNTDIPIHHYGRQVGEERYETKSRLYLEVGKKKIKANPDDPRGYRELAIQYAELGDLDNAVANYKEVLKRVPDDPQTLSDFGVLLAKQDQDDEAMIHFKHAISINPSFIPPYVNLALCLEKQQQLDVAEEYLLKASEEAPDHPVIWKNLGRLSFYARNYSKALSYFKKVKQLSPQEYDCDECALTHFELGKTFFRNNDHKLAKKHLEETTSLRPGFPEALNYLGIVLVHLNQLKKARTKFEEVIRICQLDHLNKKAFVNACVNLAYIHNYEGEFESSLKLLERAIEVDQSDPEVFNHMGIAKCGLGELEDAIHYFEIALRLNPSHQGAQVNLKRTKEILIQETNKTTVED